MGPCHKQHMYVLREGLSGRTLVMHLREKGVGRENERGLGLMLSQIPEGRLRDIKRRFQLVLKFLFGEP